MSIFTNIDETLIFMRSSCPVNIYNSIAVILWFCYRKWKLHPIVYIAISAVIGVVFQL
ncbi:MAG: hypothetical protein SOH60_03960 [Lachnospiraceae bacterium]|jgi:hypothetical protein